MGLMQTPPSFAVQKEVSTFEVKYPVQQPVIELGGETVTLSAKE